LFEKIAYANDSGTVSDLRSFISKSGLKAGERLPSERMLTDRLGVTRNKLRKALDALEREGTIWRHVGKGTFVAANDSDLEQMVSSPAELGRQLTPFRMMRARLAIEPAIAREAAINSSSVALSHMTSAMEAAHTAPTWQLYEAEDDKFHRAIAEASDNLLLLSIFDHLNLVRRAVAWGNVTRHSVKPPAEHSSFAEHEAIAKAIVDRAPAEAEAAVRRHLHSVSARLFGED